jgi:hypothetical protein
MYSLAKKISSLSLDRIPVEVLTISSGNFFSLKIKVLRPSKQSPMNSQTLGGLLPLERMVRID